MVDCQRRRASPRQELDHSLPGLLVRYDPSDYASCAHHRRHQARVLAVESDRRPLCQVDPREAASPCWSSAYHRCHHHWLLRQRRERGQYARQPRRLPLWPCRLHSRVLGHIAQPQQDCLAYRHCWHAHAVHHRPVRPPHRCRLRHLQLHLEARPSAAGIRQERPYVPDG